MKVIPVSHGLEDIVGKSTGPRSSGLHMSTIYNSLYQSLEPKRYKKGSEPDPLRLEAGLAFESFLEEALRARLTTTGSGRPGEFVTDEGIAFSPDLILFNGTTRVGEIKLTWMSSREMPTEPTNGLPAKFDKYICQMQAYCHALRTRDARLIGFFVNGDYRHPYTPQLRAWDLEFTQYELEENWRTLIAHARAEGLLK